MIPDRKKKRSSLKEAVKAELLSIFREDFNNFLFDHKRMRHNLMVEAEYPQVSTSTANKLSDQLSILVAE